MDAVFKYLINYSQYKLSRLVAGRKNYDLWRSKNFSLQIVPLKNKNLADELEDKCKKNGGFLTFSEYLTIDQYGENGYHIHTRLHGKTDVQNHWPKALVNLCVSSGYEEIIEVGCGDGELAVNTIKAARQADIKLTWSGVELNQDLHQTIRNRFAKEKLTPSLRTIQTSLKNISSRKKSLFLFSYVLDSIPPDIFVNTSTTQSYPNALVAIQVKSGVLKEVILPTEVLQKKKIFLNNGIVTSRGKSWDIRTWQLFPGQRAYIPLAAVSLFEDYAKKAPKGSLFVVIDEFRAAEFFPTTNHLGLPKNLLLYNRDCENIGDYYKNAGENLFYFPLYLPSFLKFLNTIGLSTLQYDIEKKLAAELDNKKWIPLKSSYFTYAILASGKYKRGKIVPLQLPISKFF